MLLKFERTMDPHARDVIRLVPNVVDGVEIEPNRHTIGSIQWHPKKWTDTDRRFVADDMMGDLTIDEMKSIVAELEKIKSNDCNNCRHSYWDNRGSPLKCKNEEAWEDGNFKDDCFQLNNKQNCQYFKENE